MEIFQSSIDSFIVLRDLLMENLQCPFLCSRKTRSFRTETDKMVEDLLASA
jgi:hypothetical protein